ncbi:threonine/serine dehydratase [Actinacidiphila sp. DG2A-62]|jgi:threonine dehydratase|uniref:threonine ammonia-lyase n=1 Tax=Actinacidiphila sp. DG2A-62 TaxID=3108821 RepID=UPI002DC01E6A|nr:threonine/serine dehydratase [Actinacidiphila sp. DG2A-62]MEC3992611.1 threonine/serine dehydratase [Actinacidiphila sp. DG2A-62]
MELVTIADIEAAAKRVEGVAVRTPLLFQTWDPRGSLWLKPENLQPIGAFKLRGAFNAVASLDDAARARGVVTYSSGNHAQAVAYAARHFGVPAVIVVPDIAPRVKVEATRAYGAEVVQVPIDEHEAKAHELAAARGLTLVPPFDHPAIIAGQGTAGLEIAEDLPDVEVVLVPVSGGGLASGVGAAIRARCPRARVIGVEPELAADATEGLRLGHRVDWPTADRARTIADGLRAQPSDLTFAHLREVVDAMVTVTEDEIRDAIRVLALRARLVAEPSGAVTTAAYLSRAAELPPGRTVALVSGGNVDPALLGSLLA